ncbi:MAG: hypothetical protein U0Q55_12980 [Vicinamibacterales bacterium]
MTRSTTWWGSVRLDGAFVLALLCVCLTPTLGRAAGPVGDGPRVTLVVRLYDSAGLATRDLHESGRVAAAILASAAVDVQWRRCPDLLPSGVDACRLPLAANEAVLRLIPSSGRMRESAEPLGSTLLDPWGRQAVLSTVFVDRILDVADRARIDHTQLLGRAVAHELGHLLLGSAGHSTEGLMRPFWTDDLLRSGTRESWQLLPEQAAAIRANRMRAAAADIAGGS